MPCWPKQRTSTTSVGRLNITHLEVLDAELRMRAVEAEHVAMRYDIELFPLMRATVAAAVAPTQRLVQVLMNQLGRFANENQNRLKGIEDRLQGIEDRLLGVEDQARGVVGNAADACSMQRRASNQRMHNQTVGTDRAQRRLTPLVTTNALPGNGIAGMPRFVPPAPVPLGGDIPTPPFPATIAAIDTMTMQQIHELAVYANDDFGIAQGDNIDECRSRVLRFVIGE